MSKVTTPTRELADTLNIKYHHNAKDETIQKLIDSQQNVGAIADILPANECAPMSAEEYRKKYMGDQRKESGRLVRCRIQCMNPAKKEWPGEIFSVGSAKLGTFKKFVPFNSPEPYHIPKIIYNMLLEKKCTVFYTEVDKRGNKIRKGRLVNEFAIEVLPPLTKEELSDLAKTQALKAGQQ